MARPQVLTTLRQLILSGHWPPGTRLQPAQLAEQLETSTTVVRETLLRLTGNGLVVSEPNRGFFVRRLNLQELADLTELRIRTESLALELAIARGDLDWHSRIMAANFRLAHTPRRDPADPSRVAFAWQELHKDFHQVLIEACDCGPIIRLAADLFDSTELYRCWAAQLVAPDTRDVEGEHQELVDAIVSGDAPRAAAALRTHYEATVEVVLHSGLADAAITPDAR